MKNVLIRILFGLQIFAIVGLHAGFWKDSWKTVKKQAAKLAQDPAVQRVVGKAILSELVVVSQEINENNVSNNNLALQAAAGFVGIVQARLEAELNLGSSEISSSLEQEAVRAAQNLNDALDPNTDQQDVAKNTEEILAIAAEVLVEEEVQSTDDQNMLVPLSSQDTAPSAPVLDSEDAILAAHVEQQQAVAKNTEEILPIAAEVLLEEAVQSTDDQNTVIPLSSQDTAPSAPLLDSEEAALGAHLEQQSALEGDFGDGEYDTTTKDYKEGVYYEGAGVFGGYKEATNEPFFYKIAMDIKRNVMPLPEMNKSPYEILRSRFPSFADQENHDHYKRLLANLADLLEDEEVDGIYAHYNQERAEYEDYLRSEEYLRSVAEYEGYLRPKSSLLLDPNAKDSISGPVSYEQLAAGDVNWDDYY